MIIEGKTLLLALLLQMLIGLYAVGPVAAMILLIMNGSFACLYITAYYIRKLIKGKGNA